jgi:hypothetical protein
MALVAAMVATAWTLHRQREHRPPSTEGVAPAGEVVAPAGARSPSMGRDDVSSVR